MAEAKRSRRCAAKLGLPPSSSFECRGNAVTPSRHLPLVEVVGPLYQLSRSRNRFSPTAASFVASSPLPLQLCRRLTASHARAGTARVPRCAQVSGSRREASHGQSTSQCDELGHPSPAPASRAHRASPARSQVVQSNVVKSTLLQGVILISALAVKPLLRATRNDYSSASTTSTIFYWLFHVSAADIDLRTKLICIFLQIFWLWPLAIAATYYSGLLRPSQETDRRRGGAAAGDYRGMTAKIVSDVSLLLHESAAVLQGGYAGASWRPSLIIAVRASV